jgi:hypothetical protein
MLVEIAASAGTHLSIERRVKQVPHERENVFTYIIAGNTSACIDLKASTAFSVVDFSLYYMKLS